MNLLSISINTKYAWFRIFGYGLSINWNKDRAKLFSERSGLRSIYYLGFVKFEVLKG